MAVALIVVGPEKLPDLAKTLAKQMVELKRAANSLKTSLQDDEEEKRPWEQITPENPQIADFTPVDPAQIYTPESDSNNQTESPPDDQETPHADQETPPSEQDNPQ